MLAYPKPVARFAGIALAITMGVVISSGRATAACGDYVHIVAKPTEVTAPPLAVARSQEGTPRVPCHGPECTCRPTQSAAPFTVLVVETDRAKELAPHPDLIEAGANVSSSHRGPRTLGSPTHFTVAIFDPPRVA